MFTNYSFSSVKTTEEYQQNLNIFNGNKIFTIKESVDSKCGKRIAKITRSLGFLEYVVVCIELTFSYLGSYFCKSSPHLKDAWAAFEKREWVRIVEFNESSSGGKVNQLIKKFQKIDPQTTPNEFTSTSKPPKPLDSNLENKPKIQPIQPEDKPIKSIVNEEPITVLTPDDNPVKSIANEEPKTVLTFEDKPVNKPTVEEEVHKPVNQITKPVFKTEDKFKFADLDIRTKFEMQLSEIIQEEEKSALLGVSIEPTPKFDELLVNTCLNGINALNSDVDEKNFKNIDEILKNPLEMKAFVEGLSKGNNHSLLLKLLLKERKTIEGPTGKNDREKRLIALFTLLSDSQFEATINSGEFLGMCGITECRKAITASFTAKRLGKFASNWKSDSSKKNFHNLMAFHEFQNNLKDIIKSLPCDPFLLGKLIAVLPHISSACKKDFINKIISLPHKSRKGFPYDPTNPDASKQGLFKEMLEALAVYYTKENDQRIITSNNEKESAKLASDQAKPQKHYEVNTGHLNVVYNTEEIKKEKFDQAKLQELVKILEIPYLDSEDPRYSLAQTTKTLSLMGKEDTESLIKMASPKALNRFWEIESKTTNHGSIIEDRTARLKWAFAALSDDQLKASASPEKSHEVPHFLKILMDDKNGNSQAAADALTVDQLVLIASDSRTHTALIHVITKLKSDKFHEFLLPENLDKVMPHCTPTLTEAILKRVDSFHVREMPGKQKKGLRDRIKEKYNEVLKKHQAKDNKVS